ncbi:HAD-like domain-containing protein, partial [Pilobolus umbonatus]
MDTVERPKKNSFKSLLSPTADYLLKSNIRSDKTTFRHIQLLVLDLNGTLLAKNLKTYYTRPHIYEFMEYIYSHFQVVFWTSATEGNMNRMITFFQLYPNPLLCWSRRHIGLTEAEFFDNVITVKDLNMVWERLPWYNLFNTIIVDDSPEKVCLHPHNLVQLSTFDRDNNTQDTVLLQLKEYLEKLQYQSNVANYIKHHP